MIVDRDKLRQLAGAKSSDNGLFVSAFLSTSPVDNWRERLPTFLNSALTEYERSASLGKEERKLLEQDFARIEELLRYEVTPDTGGLAIFADGGGKVFERLEMPVRVSDRIEVDKAPYLRPLLCALSLLEPFLLVRVSKDDSSIFVVDAGRVAREDDFAGPYLKSSDRETGDLSIKEYYAAARQETLIEQHYKEVAAAVDRMLQEAPIRRLVLCGQHDIVNNFRRALSQPASERVTGEFPWDAAASARQLVAQAREVIKAGRLKEWEAKAKVIKESLGKDGLGVSGFEDTIHALHRGQVRELLIDSEYRPAGWRCLECNYAGIAAVESCPMCGGRTMPVADAAGEAMRLAVLMGSWVEMSEGSATLADLGGIGGLLRYA
jgi:peptide subunit release factor 1 (eRF1)